MPKFAANLTMLFTEVPFLERFALAREAGFTYVEYLFPYDFKASELKQQLEANGLKQVLFNLPSGNWAQGDRGIAARPDRVEEFRAGVDKAVEYALELGVTRLNCLAGKKSAEYDDEAHWRVLVDNVRYAAQVLEKKGLTLVVEQINHFDIPGFFLNKTEQIIKLIEEVGMANVFVQYDIYHAQREEGELAATLRKYIDKIGHIQIADNPGRHQPGTGEINYPFLFQEIDAAGFQGYIGLEYVPSPNTQASLAWLSEFGYWK
jgi:hydroxypyruvate isomerase